MAKEFMERKNSPERADSQRQRLDTGPRRRGAFYTKGEMGLTPARTEQERKNRQLGAIVTEGRERLQQAQEAGEEIPERFCKAGIYGDEALTARNQLVVDNMALAVDITNKYLRRGIEYDDLEQQAAYGLIQAATRYNPTTASFSSFASMTIHGELKRFVSRKSEGVYFPRKILDMRPLVMETDRQMTQDGGTYPSQQQLAAVVAEKWFAENQENPPTEEELQAKIAELLPDLPYMRDKGTHVHSIDFPLGESATTIADSYSDPRDDIGQAVNRNALVRIISDKLTPVEREAVVLRYWGDISQADIAREYLGLTDMGVSHALKRARGKIGKALGK